MDYEQYRQRLGIMRKLWYNQAVNPQHNRKPPLNLHPVSAITFAIGRALWSMNNERAD